MKKGQQKNVLPFVLPEKISTSEEADAYFKLLWDNKYSYHPDDKFDDIDWGNGTQRPSLEEEAKMNQLMDQIFTIPNYDPYAYLCDRLHEANAEEAQPS